MGRSVRGKVAASLLAAPVMFGAFGASPAAAEASDAAATVAGVVQADAVCLSSMVEDRVGDSPALDIVAALAAYECSVREWGFAVATDDDWATAELDSFRVFLDADANPSTGCDGADFMAIAFADGPNGLVADLVRLNGCTVGGYVGDLAVTRAGTSNAIAMAVPAAMIGSPTRLSWVAETESVSTYDVDSAPDTGFKTEVLPTSSAPAPAPAPAPTPAPPAPVATPAPGAWAPPVTAPGASGRLGSLTRLYSAYFLRASDAGGLAYWMGRMDAGMSLAQISDEFAKSAEFQARYGALNAGDFVKLVYRNVLGREPDAGGYNHWAPRVHNGSLTRGQMMIGFSESAEYKALTQTS